MAARLLRLHPVVAGVALFAVAGAAFVAAPALARDNLPNYENNDDLLATTPSGDEGALGAMFNPAAWGLLQRLEMTGWFSSDDVRENAWDNWGFAFGKTLGLSMRRQDFLVEQNGEMVPQHVEDYQIGLGFGRRGSYSGIAYGWSGGDKDELGRKSFLAVGGIIRNSPVLSYGTVFRTALGATDRELIADFNLRPLRTPTLQLFADYAVRTGQVWNEGSPGFGVGFRPIELVMGTFKLKEAGAYQFGIAFTFKSFGATAIPSYDTHGDHARTNYIGSINPPRRGADVDGVLHRGKRFLSMELNGNATYQKATFHDPHSRPLLETVEQLDLAHRDPTVSGVAINLSGYAANPSMLWEVRHKLEEMKHDGKRIVIYGDRLGLSTYYLASVADRILMHPEGFAILPGVQMSRTYMKNLLAKVGVGFDEWRFFRYKSAYETFSREEMSEADREQRRILLEDAFDEYARGVVLAGRATRDEFDRVVDEEPLVLPARMEELGWIDGVATWHDVDEACDEVAGRDVHLISAERLATARWRVREEWGPKPVIAVVYAVGSTSLDSGMNGRRLAEQLDRYRKRDEIEAVVIRADSPGGDPLAAEMVATEIRRLREAGKPVLVSQGRVAASGGYWISMDGDEIATSPFTITGSIGVIGGWVWNEELGEKLGLTSEQLAIGRSADLFGGVTFPFTGIRIPERNLTPEERTQVEGAIFSLYDDFVGRVAEARGLDEERVRELAQGRVYLGRRAQSVELVDRVATLWQTLQQARERAGIRPDQEIEIEEYPPRPLFRLPGLLRMVSARVLGSELPLTGPPETTYQTAAARQILEHPGQPLVLTPADWLPAETMVAH